MSDLEIRPLREDEQRPAQTLFMRSLHRPPVSDAQWEWLGDSFEPGRTWGAFAGDVLAGTALSWGSRLRVPGGQERGVALVTRVGVRADHRRRGALTALMRAQLADVAARGEVFAALRATEPVIYGRFGYGVGVLAQRAVVVRDKAVFHPGLPVAGEVRLVGTEGVVDLLSALYDRVARDRVGSVARPRALWNTSIGWSTGTDTHQQVAVHTGPDGDDGFAVFSTARSGDKTVATVTDLKGATPEAVNALWRFLVSIDLLDEVDVLSRPLDEQVRAMFTDPRAVREVTQSNDLSLRLVDVPAALAARSWAGEAVLRVADPFLPENSGTYRVSPSGMSTVEEVADVELGVDVLAQLYLGAVRPSALADVGRLRLSGVDAAARVDAAFAVDRPAWAGTFF
ncbi:GNAT family N-acetyltransferase [Actinokineospora bangkokensis]|uniref:N-acetyltransferase domain-containing protein n=1 Tax=Actinokineospora bangkokensis TaxID=1193682 RepID=A0A1Q9LN38_9PSEU|nr:GNAT family N-acetyltransferase [Actinokineospora bangkokensis]OLR93440.1 hypothetical protein BJP25_14105 [Actinokineospora bangkokensis]